MINYFVRCSFSVALVMGSLLAAIAPPVVLAQTSSTPNTQAPTVEPLPSTTFHCVKVDNTFATIARRGDRVTPPMITWQDTSFGPQYTPERRCQIVSERLSQAVANNGGKLSNLQLTFGPVNGMPVICYVTSLRESCRGENVLLTLRLNDRGQEREILQQIITFSIKGQGRPLTRGGPAAEGPDPRNFAAFGAEVEKSLATVAPPPDGIENPTNPSPSPTTQPESRMVPHTSPVTSQDPAI